MSNLDWMDSAACRDHDPELFFPSSVGVPGQRQVAAAKRICHGCPVQTECGEHRARVGASTGVWGGSYRNVKAPAATRLTPINHGTDAGYTKHLERREQPCDRCRFAHAWAHRKRIEARKGVGS
jgi:WhiB family redox-sensing transcriptional regulator